MQIKHEFEKKKVDKVYLQASLRKVIVAVGVSWN
jgi:hypothetical protein